MEVWRLIDLGMAEPLLAQTFYEAVANDVQTPGIYPEDFADAVMKLRELDHATN